MKKLFLLVAVVAMMLPSCKKINEAIDDLDNRLNKLEQETIPSIDEQISAINTTLGNLDAMDKELKGYIDNLTATASSLQEQINATNTKIGEVKAELKGDIASTNSELKGEIATAKADVLAQLEALETELKNELATINTTIDTLKAKDTELDNKIAELRSYVDTELGETTDWVNATFTTLEQYNSLVSEIATIKEQIKAINQSITNLETRLTTKINEDIANAVSTLNADIQQKVSEITDAYTNAVKTAKEEITSAYTTAIQTAITTLDNSLKSWVGEQLSNYYTIAQVDALISSLSAEFEGKLSTQKIYLESLITSLSQTLTSKITDNSNLITALRNDLTTLDGEVAKNAEAIANNAEKISENASAIIENTKAIVANSNNIEANQEAIAANAALIAENKQLIAGIDININGVGSEASIQAIADNAKAIANNAELIAQNSLAINNNASAIAQNAADIAQLQQNLTTTKTEITEAYKSAISTAITTLDGELRGEIATQVSSLSTRIDSEVATINNSINALTARVTTLENEVAAIKQQIAKILSDIADMKEDIANLLARIQSVSYVPKYSDGKADIDYDTKTVELDFQVSPKSAIADLTKLWKSALTAKTSYTATRAVSYLNTPIIGYSADEENATIAITVSLNNLDEEFFDGIKEASMALQISDGNSFVSSDYVGVYDRNLYEIRYISTNDVALDKAPEISENTLISHSYHDGVGVIRYSAPIRTLPDKVFDQKQISSIELPRTITIIPDFAFRSCENLISIIIPNNTTSIGDNAFNGCISLTNVTLPNRVTKIGGEAFTGCTSLTNITIGNSVTSIDRAFYGCSSLMTIYCKPTIPPAIYWFAYRSNGSFPKNSGMKIYVPRNSYDAYKQYSDYTENSIAQTNWSQYESYIEPYDFE